jgi:hypothetical protein
MIIAKGQNKNCIGFAAEGNINKYWMRRQPGNGGQQPPGTCGQIRQVNGHHSAIGCHFHITCVECLLQFLRHAIWLQSQTIQIPSTCGQGVRANHRSQCQSHCFTHIPCTLCLASLLFCFLDSSPDTWNYAPTTVVFCFTWCLVLHPRLRDSCLESWLWDVRTRLETYPVLPG